jgi:predicted hotdog family 3-hydroxylacyl-ACP dehydratase
MILLDRVIDYGEDYIHTIVTIREGSPFCKDGIVPSYVSLEYMAQAIGVWSGMKGRQQNKEPQIGFLLGTRKLDLAIPAFKEGSDLHVYGQSKYNDGEMAAFKCWINIQEEQVASAVLNIFQPQNMESFLPNHRNKL